VSRRYSNASDWGTLAIRLEDIASAYSGEDTFDEVHALLLAKVAHEYELLPYDDFLPSSGRVGRISEWLAAAQQSWPGLHTTYMCRLPEAALIACDTLLGSTRITDEENSGLDAVFEYLTTRAAKGSKGQFFTPRHVVQHMLHVLMPGAGEYVLDPACGSGAFLAQAKRYAPRSHIQGADLSPRAVRVCRTALVPGGTVSDAITCMDSLDKKTALPEAWRAGIDVIVTNPPFAGAVSKVHAEGYTLHHGNRRIERDVLFIERCVELLKPGGRIGIIVPHNKVGSQRYADVRSWLLRYLKLFAVVSLPKHTFAPHTSQRAVIIYGQKRPSPLIQPKKNESILFFVSTADAKLANGRLRKSSDTGQVQHDLNEATESIRTHIETCVGTRIWG